MPMLPILPLDLQVMHTAISDEFLTDIFGIFKDCNGMTPQAIAFVAEIYDIVPNEENVGFIAAHLAGIAAGKNYKIEYVNYEEQHA